MNEQNRWLISLSIGPVQDFITAALRTRDLWFGSHMLSEISKCAATAMNVDKVELIFPAMAKKQEPTHKTFSQPVNVANRIVAVVTGNEAEAKEIIEIGRKEAQGKMNKFVEEAKEQAAAIISLREEVWKAQAKMDDLLELHGTGVLIKDGDYAEARGRLNRLTAARKNSRDFLQPATTFNEKPLFYGLPKSSLDGRRETVFHKHEDKKNKQIRRKLRMGRGEQLDVLGLVKRLAVNQADQFTPTTRIAVDPWIRKISEEEGPESSLLAGIRNQLQDLADLPSDFLTRVRGNKGKYKSMPFDAGLLYPGPLAAAIRDCKEEGKTREKEQRALQALHDNFLKETWARHGHPDPYYGLIFADGDHMGALLDGAKKKEDHQKISRQLAEFAGSIPKTVRDYHGHCIYAGGDDILLMVPLDRSLALADKLRKDFHQGLAPLADKLRIHEPNLKEPTLSIGLVLAHMQAPVGRVRRLAAEAEKIAKGTETLSPRNALGIIIAPRSGTEIRHRIPWPNEQEHGLELNRLAGLYRDDKIPSGFGYELRQLDLLLDGITDTDLAEEMKQLEFKRILKRKNSGGSQEKMTDDTKQALLDHAVKNDSPTNRNFGNIYKEHLVARWLGKH